MRKYFVILCLFVFAFLLVSCGEPVEEDPIKYLVTFNSNGGPTTMVFVEEGLTVQAPADPVKAGYTFIGWFKDVDLTESWIFSTDVVQSSITLYAKYEIIPGLEEIAGISLNDLTTVYDTQEKVILITGTLPSGVTVEYTNNRHTDAGTYEVTAVLTGEGYAPLTLTATMTINKVSIGYVDFVDRSYTYDGQEKEIRVTGSIPTGATVAYSNNLHTDAGVYQAVATITGTNYNTLTLNATLTINKATLTGITFSDETIEYDAQVHEILVTGVIPEGVTVEYEYNSGTEVGTYEAVATINGGTNYNNLTLSATLTIKSTEIELFSYVLNDSVYFQNNLDDDQLYKYNLSTEVLSRVNGDTAQYFTILNNELYYRNDSLFMPSITKLRSDDARTTILNVNAEYLVSDGTYLYYAINSLFGDHGIYRATIGSEATTTIKIADVKAKYLVVDSTNIYFANFADSGKLYKVNKSVASSTPVLVYDVKINDLILDNGILYFAENNLINDVISSVKVDGTDYIKISNNKAKYLVKDGDYIYYSNIDLLTSNVFGKGLYRVHIPTKVSTKLLDDDSTVVSSINVSDGKVFFYKVADKNFYYLDLSTDEVVNLLEGFVPVEVILNGMSGTIATYGNSIYFQNFYDNHKLYRYDLLTQKTFRITSVEVDEILIEGDYLYYRAVTYFVNKDLYRINLAIGGAPELITANDVSDFVVDGNKIYYKNYTGDNTLNRMNLDGSGIEVLYNGEVNNIRVYDDQLYFMIGKRLQKANLDGTDLVQLYSKDILRFEIYEDTIYYILEWTVLSPGNKLYYMNLDGSSATLVSPFDAQNMVFEGQMMYFYNDQITNFGIFEFNLTTKATPTMINETVAEDITVLNGVLYYYKSSSLDLVNGDGHLYFYDISEEIETKLQ
ncbi:MAG: DUF5050 domain-containing protein [Acholeplasmataceae bacterium]|nr:DUF5050 domain-containing protein [Acholeplasmataceae bacterium]